MGCTCANKREASLESHVNRSVSSKPSGSAVYQFDHRFSGSDPVRLVAGFRKETGLETSLVDGPTGWTGRSGPVFKTLVLNTKLFVFLILHFYCP